MNLILTLSLLLYFTSSNQSKEIQIGAVPLTPMVQCQYGDEQTLQQIKDQLSIYQKPLFSGYEIEFLILLFENLNWNLAEAKIKCYNEQQIYEKINNSQIQLGLGCIKILYDQSLVEMVNYSLPTYSSGLKMATQNIDKLSSIVFLQPFDPILWVVILFTTLITGVITWLFEDRIKKTQITKYCCYRMIIMIWESFASFFYASQIRLQNFSAKIIFLSFWIIVMILIATYSANLTVILWNKETKKEFYNMEQLTSDDNMIYYTFQNYVTGSKPLLDKTQFKGEFKLYEVSQQGLNQIIEEFLQIDEGTSKVIILDLQIIEYLKSKYRCSIQIYYEPLINFHYGFAVSKNEIQLLEDINKMIIKIRQSPRIVFLQNKYINVASQQCECLHYNGKLDLSNLWGLWLFLGAVIGIALIIYHIQNYWDQKSKTNSNKTDKSEKNEKLDKINSNGAPNILSNEVSQEPNLLSDILEQNKQSQSFLFLSDYIHIPNKEIYKTVEPEITKCLIKLYELIIERFTNTEKKIVQIIQKAPMPKQKTEKIEDLSDIDLAKDIDEHYI